MVFCFDHNTATYQEQSREKTSENTKTKIICVGIKYFVTYEYIMVAARLCI